MSLPRKKANRRRANGEWALILIDGGPIRFKTRKEYEKVLRDLDRSREQIKAFEATDKPGFHQWLNRTFGGLVTELREAHAALQSRRELLNEVEEEAMFSNSSYGRAYAEVLRRKENPEPESPPDPEPKSERGDRSGGDRKGDPFEEFFAGIEEDFERLFGESHRPRGHDGSDAHGAKSSGLKEVYRALARRLHPDTQGVLTPQQTEWWHQVQAAYEKGDVEQLRTILTLCEIDEQGINSKTSVSMLQRSIQQLKLSLNVLRKQLAQFRHDPAWGFSRLKDREPLRQKIARELSAELAEIKLMLSTVNRQLEVWAHQSQNRRRRSRRRGPGLDQTEIFF